MERVTKKVGIILMIIIIQFIIYLNTEKANANAEQIGSWDVSYDSSSNVIATLYNDGSLVISGTGKMKNCSSDNLLVVEAYRDNIENIRIENGVTSIGYNAFHNYKKVKSISISNTVEEIGGGAFIGCQSLKAIHIPSSVKTIGSTCFASCENLNTVSIDLENNNFIFEKGILYNKDKTRIITCSRDKQEENYVIPSTVEEIDGDAFMNCSRIKNITLPEGIENINRGIFFNCNLLQSVNIPSSVKNIGDYVFWGCKSLEEIIIPANVETIGNMIFNGCVSLTNVSIDNNNTNYIMEDGILYDKDKTRIIKCSSDKQKETYNIPDTVKEIDSYAFYKCNLITNIELPAGFDSINSYLFCYCTALEKIDIPYGTTSIGTCAFSNCNSLKSINMRNNVMTIGNLAFYNCSIENINITPNVKTIGKDALGACFDLTSISIDENNQYFEIEDGILYNKEKTRIIICSRDEQKEEYNIPSTVEDIDDFAFMNCDKIKRVNLSDKINTIGGYLFYGCKSLEEINIPGSVTKIQNRAFGHCTKLRSIIIPDSVAKIDTNAFSDCDSIQNINIPKNVDEIGEEAFAYCNNLSSVILDQNNNNFTMENGILYDKEKTRIIICSRDKQQENYEIPSTVKTIDDTAFLYCDSIKSIKISENVEKIGEASFGYCKNLKSISLNPSNSNFIIEDGILYNKDKTKVIICIKDQQKESYELPLTVKKIDQSAFLGCDRIKSIKLPDELNYIGPAMFWYCSSLENIVIPEKVTMIYNNEFYENNNIIHINPFRGCKSLKNINVDENNENFSSENGILYNKEKTKLLVYPQGKAEKVFIMPNNIQEIGDIAFSEDSKLEKLIILENVKDIGTEILNENDVTTIYCKRNTDIEELARENNLRYEIDEEAPEIISVEGNTQKRVEDKVILTINAEDDRSGLSEKAYSFDGGQTWQENNKKEYTKNTKGIIIKVKDNIGNVGEYNNEINITNIKKIKKVTIKQMPKKVEYKKGEEIDLDGLILDVEYDDGTKEEVTEGYTTNVNNLNEVGDKDITVSYEGKEVIFKITVLKNNDGDKQDGDKQDGDKQDGDKQDGDKQDGDKQNGDKQDEDRKNNQDKNEKQDTESNNKQETIKSKEDPDTANNNKTAKNTITNLSNNKLPYTGLIGKMIPIGIIITLSVAIITCIGYIKYKNLK